MILLIPGSESHDVDRPPGPTGDRPFLTVLMPAYNEESCLAASVARLSAALRERGVAAEILIVDDGSRDRTAAIADRLAASVPNVRVCHHAANLGIGGGFCTGVREAHGAWLILIPADLALDLGELRKYLEAAPTADIVVGNRSDRRDNSRWRRLISLINIALIRLLFGMKLHQFNYISMYRVELLRRMDVRTWRSAFFFAEVLIRAEALGGQLVEVNINYVPRATGRATGARAGLLFRTVRDMLSFWLYWRTTAWSNPPSGTGPKANHNR